MGIVRKLFLYIQAGFYVAAGANHFLNPDFYFGLIPPYLPWPVTINIVAGVVEIVFGFMLLVPSLRRLASYGIVAMLVAFIPSHIYFIEIGSCIEGGLCTTPLVAWVRLVVIHPILIWWAFVYRSE